MILNENQMKTEIILSRHQVMKLHEYMAHFKEVEEVVVTSNNTSGIGKSIIIHMDLFNMKSVTADISDYENW
jgi:hypothetical protein